MVPALEPMRPEKPSCIITVFWKHLMASSCALVIQKKLYGKLLTIVILDVNILSHKYLFMNEDIHLM